MLLLIDNYDSFTYNLVDAFTQLGANVEVVKSDRVTVQECLEKKPSKIVIGPGPGAPKNAGISLNLIGSCINSPPLLGICLGHQCLSEAFGGQTIRAKKAVHGKTSAIVHQNEGVFYQLPQNFQATRYHSLVTDRSTLPDCLKITAETCEGEIMGIRHRTLPLEGVQFHPESILSEAGFDLLENFLKGD